jgi:hypothetical protein
VEQEVTHEGPVAENQHHSKSWLPEAEETVIYLWGIVEPYIIARILNAWLYRIYLIERKYKGVTFLTGSSVIDHAFRLGLIDGQAMIDLKDQERKQHKQRMKQADWIEGIDDDGTVWQRKLFDYEHRSWLTYKPNINPLDLRRILWYT